MTYSPAAGRSTRSYLSDTVKDCALGRFLASLDKRGQRHHEWECFIEVEIERGKVDSYRLAIDHCRLHIMRRLQSLVAGVSCSRV